MDFSIAFVVCVSAFTGALIQGASGFGFAIILMMIMPYFIPYTDALAVASFTCIFMVSFNVYLHRKHIVWKYLAVSSVVFVATNFLAIRLLKSVGNDPIWLKLLGILFVVMAVYLFFGQGKIKIQPSLLNALLINGVGGIINGLFGAGGVLVVLYFMAILDDKEEYISTLQMFFFLTILFDFALRAGNGMVSGIILQYGINCLPCIILGIWLGKKLFDKINSQVLCRIVYGVMILNGIWLVIA